VIGRAREKQAVSVRRGMQGRRNHRRKPQFSSDGGWKGKFCEESQDIGEFAFH
jgi:hypothetical protein